MARMSKEKKQELTEQLQKEILELQEKEIALSKADNDGKKGTLEKQQKAIDKLEMERQEKIAKLEKLLPQQIEKPERKARKSKKIGFATERILKFLFRNILSKRLGEHWILDEEESKALAECLDDVMIENAEFLKKHSAKINLAFWSFMIIAPRIETQLQLQRQGKKDSGKSKE